MSSVYQLKRKELANDLVRFFSDKNNAKKDVAYLVIPKIVSNNVAYCLSDKRVAATLVGEPRGSSPLFIFKTKKVT